MSLLKRLQNLWRNDTLSQNLDDEMRSHIEMRSEDNIAAGMTPEEARQDARTRFGSTATVEEETREADTFAWIETIGQDLLYGFRMMRKNPGFTAVAVIILALGIGLNTGVFTAYKAMVARPIEAFHPGEIVNLAMIHDSGAADFFFSNPDYEEYRDSMRSFSGLIAFSPETLRFSTGGVNISKRSSPGESGIGKLGLVPSGTSNAEFASVFVVSENYFKVLGVAPLRGRTFDSMGTSEILASPSVLISENYWRSDFAGEPAILGKTIYLNGVAVTIAGITPHDLVGTGVAVPEFWLPLRLAPLVHSDNHWLSKRENQCCRLFGRLAPGVSMTQAQGEMDVIANHLRTLHEATSELAKPSSALVWPGSPFPLPIRFYRGLAFAILLIMAASGMVLAIACADVGSLQLARARSRELELRTRLALGASRLRIVRQLLTESALLGLLAGILAFLLSWGLLKATAMLAAGAIPSQLGMLVFDVTPDLEIFIYVFAISLVAGILFGLAPALESSRSALSGTVRGVTTSIRSRRIQKFLIAVQVALSLAIMIAGTLLIRSSLNSLRIDTGYETKHVVDVDLQFPEAPKYSAGYKVSLIREIRTRLAALPEVTAVTSARPPGDNRFQTAATPLDPQKPPTQNTWLIHYSYVQASYFKTLGIPVVMGQVFESQASQSERSVIVSESAARQLSPGQNPVGRIIRLGPVDEQVRDPRELVADGAAYQIIGVVRDIRGVELNGNDSRQLYLQLPEERLQGHAILIRIATDASQFTKAIEPVITSIDPDLVESSSTLDELLRRSPSFIVNSVAAAIASGVGLLGFLPALIGIYGTVSYVVVLRTREIGIRMAVGAQKRDIIGLILRESTRPVLAGLFAGILLAVGASHLLHGVLYGLSTVDIFSFVSVSLSFLAIALLAAFLPARRATRVDPLAALRNE